MTSDAAQMTGFVGLGRMGRPMAGHLLTSLGQLSVYDIDPDAVGVLVQKGADAAGSLATMAKQSDIIFTVLPSHHEVEQVVLGADGLAAHAKPGALIVDMSTIAPAVTDKVSAELRKKNIRFVDAPIGRLASHADAGECLFMVGASAADFADVQPMLSAMGTDIHHCGEPGTGIRTKLINNFLAITSCQMNAEALTLAGRFGLDLEKTLEVIHGTTATNGQLKLNYASKVLKGDVTPGFQIDLAHKDLALVLQAANEDQVPMPIGAAAKESLSSARARGWGGKDFSGLLDAWCELSGIDRIRFDG